jgi:hypothetical protein
MENQMSREYGWPKGPWRWQGEDYRGGWGWQMLVDASGGGILVGQGSDGGPSPYLKAYEPVAGILCITGMGAHPKEHVEFVHVLQSVAAVIKAAPELVEALENTQQALSQVLASQELYFGSVEVAAQIALDNANKLLDRIAEESNVRK